MLLTNFSKRFTFFIVLFSLLFSTQLHASEEITLNMQDADIRALISTVSKFTGKNFIIDPRVKAKVTVVSNRSMNKKQVYEVFLSILQVHGFAAVDSGAVTKIVPEVEAKQDALKIADSTNPGTGDELVTQIIQLDHVPAAQLVPILRPLIPQQGHLAAYNPTNALIVTDHAANIHRLLKIIDEVDQANNSELEIIRLENASATEMVRILTALQSKTAAKEPTSEVMFAADERTNSILVSGDRSERLRVRATIAHLDTPLENGGNTHVIYLHYAKAEDIVKVLTGLEKNKTAGPAAAAKVKSPAGDISTNIQSDEATNAIIITASQDEIRNLKSVIRQLDIRRAQVLIESIIAEISYGQSEEVGVGLVSGNENNSTDNPLAISNIGAIGGLLAAGAQGGNLAGGVGAGLTLALANSSGNGNQLGIIINALSQDAATNVLSTPSVVTLDNEEAEILIGDEIPVLTGSYSSTGGSTTPTNPFQTIERKDVGITLKVKPQINEGNTIKLDLEQEVSSLSETTAAGPVTNKRSIKTSVLVEDNEVLVLGGLVQDRLLDNFDSIPFLGDIPLVGRLFQSETSSKVKQNLMVFMRPSILRDSATANRVTSSKYNYIRAQQIQAEDKRYGLIRNSIPLLNELDQKPAQTTEPATEQNTGEQDNANPASAAPASDGEN